MPKRIQLPLTVLLATLIVSLMPALIEAQQSAPENAQWAEITGDNVRIRAGASTQYQALTTASRGERFIVVGERRGWAELQANHQFDAFVHRSLVDADGSTGEISGSRVIIRLRPSQESFRLTSVTEGTRVNIVERHGDWYQIVPPVGVSVWVSGDFVRTLGQASGSEFEAYRLGRDLDEMRAETPQSPTSSETDDSDNRERVRQAEQRLLDDLDERFDATMAEAGDGEPTDEMLDKLRRLAHEFEAFADAAQSPEITDEARQRSESLRGVREDLVAARMAADAQAEEEHVEAEEAEADAEADAEPQPAPRADDAARQRALERLLYQPSEDYLAVGKVADARDSEGRRVYILVHEGEVLFRIELSPQTRDVDLRSLWHRTVAVRGRVVKIEGEPYPTIVCTEITPK